ncbi:MAG: radical SAM protein, partial [Spirochaetota bacterium]
MIKHEKGKMFIDRARLYSMVEGSAPSASDVDAICSKARLMKGLSLEDVAVLLRAEEPALIRTIMDAAHYVKEEIYGKRLVLFAPIYTGNRCVNNCTYCAFRRDNKELKRSVLSMDEIAEEVRCLLRDGHKRILLICGEHAMNNTDYMCEAIRTAYSVREGKNYVRRINLELAPMSVDDFRKLKDEKIGTYVCFQETYDPELYKIYHPAGTPKADYEYRVTVMDRAMEAGI